MNGIAVLAEEVPDNEDALWNAIADGRFAFVICAMDDPAEIRRVRSALSRIGRRRGVTIHANKQALGLALSISFRPPRSGAGRQEPC